MEYNYFICVLLEMKRFLVNNYAIIGVLLFAIVYHRCLIHGSEIYKECEALKEELIKMQKVIADDKRKFVASKSK